MFIHHVIGGNIVIVPRYVVFSKSAIILLRKRGWMLYFNSVIAVGWVIVFSVSPYWCRE